MEENRNLIEGLDVAFRENDFQSSETYKLGKNALRRLNHGEITVENVLSISFKTLIVPSI